MRAPRNVDTNDEVRRAWTVRIREALLRLRNQPERCECEVSAGLNRHPATCQTLLENGMRARLKADARWQHAGYENAWTRGWPKEEPSALFWKIVSVLTYARTRLTISSPLIPQHDLLWPFPPGAGILPLPQSAGRGPTSHPAWHRRGRDRDGTGKVVSRSL